MELSQHFWENVKHHIKSGQRIAELYHGEKSDILKGLSKIVGENGIIYGIDELNPFKKDRNMKKLQKIPNIQLIKALMPPIPKQATNLDATIIREFIWTYPLPFNGTESPEIYRAIDSSIKQGGHLILHLNQTEQKSERDGHQTYQKTIIKQLPNFQKIYDNEDLLIYRKEN